MARLDRFTIEMGRGATYQNHRWTVYQHGTYPRGSVLAGQPSRRFVESYESLEAAQAAYPHAEVLAHGGTTYRDINAMTAHLPGEDDPQEPPDLD